MEQRIGSSSQPLEGAGFDPAFIPGLTSPASGRKEDAKATTDTEPRDTAPEETAPEAEPEAEAVPDGPVFEASDRRARIVADHRGVRLSLDDQECEFRWDEIGAVETETARFGKRYTVTVHTPDSRWYPIEVEAPSRGSFAEWDTALDEVLDAYFEDGETPDAEDDAQDDVKGDAEAEAEADDKDKDAGDDGKTAAE
ncbi:hypothetical protein SHKM778_12970 [Streptomyces sp. KM77-8]|uniref:DUF3027 domain-containing protein n=1 Tax=Streptomyces haneummycinicus TaxID=3074435 RepID=A0AAT9HBY1_9ACTN